MMRIVTITTALLSTMLTSMASADATLVTTPLPGGTSAVGAYTPRRWEPSPQARLRSSQASSPSRPMTSASSVT